MRRNKQAQRASRPLDVTSSSEASPTPQTRNKRFTPEQYARLKFQREERERVTGNSEKGRKL